MAGWLPAIDPPHGSLEAASFDMVDEPCLYQAITMVRFV